MTFPDHWSFTLTIGDTHTNTFIPILNTAILRDGWIVSTWRDATTKTYKCQIVSADGSPFGQAFDIGVPGEAANECPSIVAMPNGQFIVAYVKETQGNLTIVQETWDVFGGKADSNAIFTRPIKDGIKLDPAICAFEDGSFYITYTSLDAQQIANGVSYFRYANDSASYGKLDSTLQAESLGKIAASTDRLANLERSSQDGYLYLNLAKSDGTEISRTAVAPVSTVAGEYANVAALKNGNFAVTYSEAVSGGVVLKSSIISPHGTVLQTFDLHTISNGNGFGSISITALSESDFAFAAVDLYGIYVGIYKNGVANVTHIDAEYPQNAVIKSLNDGRILVEWTEQNGLNFGILKAQIYDPRTDAVDWHGGDIGQQYAGTKFADGLHGGSGNDTLFGGAGNDVLEGGGGSDRLDGGADWDVASYLNTPANQGGIILNMTTGETGGAATGDVLVNIEVVQGTNTDDTITGLDRGNGLGVALYGMGGKDTLIGKGGGDFLYGGDGNDWLSGGAGGDVLDGGADWDMVSYHGMATGIVVDMTTNQNSGAAAGDTLTDIEAVQGTESADIITSIHRGNGIGAELYGEGGADTLIGKEGGDRLFGGAGDDWLVGGAGNDFLDGGADQNTAVFTGARQGYLITKNADGTFTVSGQDGTDTLMNINYARFDDQTVLLADMTASQNPDVLTFTDGSNSKAVDDDDVMPDLGILKAHDPDDSENALLFSIDASDQNQGKFHILNGNVLAVASGTLAAGTYTVKVRVSDIQGGVLVKDFTITSTHANVAPVVDGVEGWGSGHAGSGADAGKILVNEDIGPWIVARISAHDTDGGTIGYALATNPNDIFRIDQSGYIAVKNTAALQVAQDTDYTLKVLVSDGQGGTTTQDVAIKVKDVNRAPVVDSLSSSQVDEGSDISTPIGVFSVHDPEDGQTGLVFELKDSAGNPADANGLFAVDALGRLTVAQKLPEANGDQAFGITLKVSDKNKGPGSVASYYQVQITVKDVVDGNHAPNQLTLNNGTFLTINENAAFTGTLSAQDSDGDKGLTWTFDNTVAGHANNRFEIVDGGNGTKQLKLKAPLDYEELQFDRKYVTVYLKASDGKEGGTSATQAFRIYVADVNETNHAPSGVALSGARSAAEYAAAGTLIGSLSATDADGDALSYALTDNAGGRFVLSGHNILVADGFRLDFEQARSHAVTVQVSDGHGGVASQTFAIGVTDVAREVTAGTAGHDVFKAGKYNDRLGGGLGNDKLWGGLGNDQLTGGKGRDTFVFDTKFHKSKNKDLIRDYSVKDDTIWLDNALFKANKTLYAAIKKGSETKPLKMASKFFSLDHAKDKDDFFVYDSHKRVLYYDADGSGSKAGIAIASFTSNKALKNFTYKEFFFV